jgi:hypothetical protein
VTVLNVGGPAINFFVSHFKVRDYFALNQLFVENGGSTPNELGGTLTKLQSIAITPVPSELGDRYLYVEPPYTLPQRMVETNVLRGKDDSKQQIRELSEGVDGEPGITGPGLEAHRESAAN